MKVKAGIDLWIHEGWEKMGAEEKKVLFDFMAQERQSLLPKESPFSGYKTSDLALIPRVEDLPRWIFLELRFAAVKGGLNLQRYTETLARVAKVQRASA
jgi:hypothetical protein